MVWGWADDASAGLGDPPHNTHLNAARGPELGSDCSACHTGSPAYNNVQQSSCVPCHSQGGFYDGVFDATIGATENWDNSGSPASATVSFIYSNGSLKPGKERWCGGCHDEDPAGVLIDDFEGYSDQVALRNEWKAKVDAKKPVLQLTGGVKGSQAMRINLAWEKSNKKRGKIKREFSPYIDLTGTGSLRLYIKTAKKKNLKAIKVRLHKDGGGIATAKVPKQLLKDKRWELVSIPRADFDDDTWGKVTAVEFTIAEKDPTILTKKAKVELDDLRAVPMADDLPRNIIGDNTTYGYYVTGHGTFANCTRCHDSEKDHIDDDNTRRSVFAYITRIDNPTGFRFYDDPTKQMQLPYNVYEPGSTGAFAMCYACHNEACITQNDISTNLETNFTEEGLLAGGAPANLHLYHVGGENYPDIGDLEPLVYHGTCVLCHDVMAPQNVAMSRSEMGDLIYFDADGCEITNPDLSLIHI